MKYNCQPAHPSSESLVVSSSESSQISFVLSLPHLPNVSIVQNWWDYLWSVTEVACPLVWTPLVPERLGHSTKAKYIFKFIISFCKNNPHSRGYVHSD